MFILRFTVTNHGSFRDEAELSMVSRRLRANVPPDGDWPRHVQTIAAIYGPNASGKSQFLDALEYFRAIIKNSATLWTERKNIPRSYFKLNETSKDEPSTYVLDFIHNNVRHEYGFTVTTNAVTEEWLHTFPTGRKRILFDRSADSLEFGRSLKGGEATLRQATGPQELVLSKGAFLKNPQLREIHHQLVQHLEVTEFGDQERHTRLSAFVHDLVHGTFELDDVRLMLRVADIGIAGAEVTQEDPQPGFEKILRALYEATNETVPDDEIARAVEETTRALSFEHTGADNKTYPLKSTAQSSGTLTWLSLAAPAIHAIRYGGVLVIDELDASLHPQLAEVLILMFKEERTNPRHAQLIFTTHDTYFMSPTSQARLNDEEVYFVEKGRDGASELFSLADFPVRKNDNFSRRYLNGRYGAVPTVAPAFLNSLVEMKEARHASAHEELT